MPSWGLCRGDDGHSHDDVHSHTGRGAPGEAGDLIYYSELTSEETIRATGP
jgi:hypothetical protein